MKLNTNDAQFAWNPIKEGGDVEVGPFPDKTGWTKRYRYARPFADERGYLPSESELFVIYLSFNRLVVQCSLDPKKVHAAFMNLTTYAMCTVGGELGKHVSSEEVRDIIAEVRAAHAKEDF